MRSKSFVLFTGSPDLTASVLDQIDRETTEEVKRFTEAYLNGPYANQTARNAAEFNSGMYFPRRMINVQNQTITPFKHTDGTWHIFVNIAYTTEQDAPSGHI